VAGIDGVAHRGDPSLDRRGDALDPDERRVAEVDERHLALRNRALGFQLGGLLENDDDRLRLEQGRGSFVRQALRHRSGKGSQDSGPLQVVARQRHRLGGLSFARFRYRQAGTQAFDLLLGRTFWRRSMRARCRWNRSASFGVARRAPPRRAAQSHGAGSTNREPPLSTRSPSET
jgi:hypothetical protein